MVKPFVALLLLAPAWLRSQETIGIPVGQTPPAVTLQNLNGDSVSLSRWIGKKPVIVEFWATWCPICAELLPRMEAAHHKYGARAEFLVVAVAVNESQNTVRRHLDGQHTLWHGTRCFGQYDAQGRPLPALQREPPPRAASQRPYNRRSRSRPYRGIPRNRPQPRRRRGHRLPSRRRRPARPRSRR